MDLDLCIKCDNCVRACESLHGRSRLISNGVQIGGTWRLAGLLAIATTPSA